MKARAPVSSRFLLLCTRTTSPQRACELSGASWSGGGSTQTPAELSHPLSSPCFLLPDELWLAGLIVCAQQTNVGSWTGLSKLCPPPQLKNMKPATYSFLRPPNQSVHKRGFQEVTITWEMCATLSEYYWKKPLVVLLRFYKIQDIINSFNEFYRVKVFWRSIFVLSVHKTNKTHNK